MRKYSTSLACLASLVFLAQLLAQDLGDLNGLPPRGSTHLIDDVDGGMGVTVTQQDKWIGIMCRPVGPSLRAHIAIPDDAGLLVEEVIPDSPSANAGLEKYDILLSANGTPLSTIGDLIQAVGEAGNESLTLEWLRHGEVIDREVTPAERPAHHTITLDRGDGPQPMFESLRAWADQLEGQGPRGRGPMKVRVFGEGFGVRDQDHPTDLNVEIQKQGNALAKITVRRGDSSWEVTEDRIEELPDNIQPFVKNMLGGGRPFRFEVDGPFEYSAPFDNLHDSIQQMNERLDEMFNELRELRDPEPVDDDTIDA